jgi:metal-responsive CopG/Arc/MetJ family transcriptional regulator
MMRISMSLPKKLLSDFDEVLKEREMEDAEIVEENK